MFGSGVGDGVESGVGYVPGPLAQRLLRTIGIDAEHLHSKRVALPYLVAGLAMCLYLPYGTWAISHALSLADAGSGHVSPFMVIAALGVTAVIIGFDALIIGYVPVNTERLSDIDERPLGRLSKAMVALRLVIAVVMVGVFTVPTMLFFFQRETTADLASQHASAIQNYEKHGLPAQIQTEMDQITKQDSGASSSVTALDNQASTLDSKSAQDYQLALADSNGNGVKHLAGCPVGGDCWTLIQQSQQESAEAEALRQQAKTLQGEQAGTLANNATELGTLTTEKQNAITEFTNSQNNDTGLGACTKSLINLAVHDPYGIGLAAAIILAVAALLELAVIGIKVTASRDSEYERSVARATRSALWAEGEVEAAATEMTRTAVQSLKADESLSSALYEQKRRQIEAVFRSRFSGPSAETEGSPGKTGSRRPGTLGWLRPGASRWVAGLVVLALVAGGLVYATNGSRGYQSVLDLRDGGKLIVPSGTISQNRPVHAAYRPDKKGWSGHQALAPPVTLTTDGTLKGQPVLEFMVPPSKRADAVAGRTKIAYLTSAGWKAFPSTYDPKTGMLSAKLTHFSTWAPWDWDWASIGADISQTLLQVAGSRTSKRPSCNTSALPTPSWLNVAGTAGMNDSAGLVILACQQGHAGDDTLDVEIVNNRPYGMILTYGSGVKYGWHESGATVGTALEDAIGDYVAQKAGGLYLPPLSSASVGIANPHRNGGQLIFPISASAGTAIADLAQVTSDELLKGLGTGVGKALGVTTAQAMASSQACTDALANWAPQALDISQSSVSKLLTSDVPGCVKDILVQAGRSLISSGKVDSTEFAAVSSMVNRLNPLAALSDLASWGQKLAVIGDYFIDKENAWVPGLGYGFSLLLRYAYSPPNSGGGASASSGGATSGQAGASSSTPTATTTTAGATTTTTTAPASVSTTTTTTQPPQQAVIYDTLQDPNVGYGSCSGDTTDPRGGAPAGRFVQSFVVPSGVTTITDVVIPQSKWLSYSVDFYRGSELIGGGAVPAGADWNQIDVNVGNIAIQPGETLSLVAENPQNPTGIGFWEAVTTSNVYPQGSLSVSNPCAWAQGAHPANDQPTGDLVAKVNGLT